MTVPTKQRTDAASVMEAVIIKGDLSKLTPDERVRYYNETCKSLGLNPLTRPFEYITLNGRLQLYARRDAADQLRKVNGISVAIVSQEIGDGTLTVHVKARDRDGREDEDLGVVPFHDGIKGEARANQILKCVTKAKRRVTLSISGLGLLDETEVADIPRENPHVNRPEDFVEVPLPDDPDSIPPNPNIKPLPKKDARADNAKLQQEMQAITDPEKLKEWGAANKDRVAAQPLDWQEIFRGLYRNHLIALRNDAGGALRVKLVESAFADLDNAYENCEDAAGFFDIDEKMYQPLLPQLSPADQQRAGKIRERHMARFAEP